MPDFKAMLKFFQLFLKLDPDFWHGNGKLYTRIYESNL